MFKPTIKTLILCRPCAEGLRAGGQRLAALAVKTSKNTCEECGRRRYTLRYQEGEGPQCKTTSSRDRPTARRSGR